MINPYKTVDWDPSPGKIRKTMGVIALFALLLFGIIMLRTGISFSAVMQKYSSIFYAVLIVLLIAGIFPVIGKWVFRIWFGITCTAGFLISNLILLTCFYAVITPLALIRRLFGAEPLPMKPKSGSSWEGHPDKTDPADYFRQF